jgi:hypothetical protein
MTAGISGMFCRFGHDRAEDVFFVAATMEPQGVGRMLCRGRESSIAGGAS